MTFRLHWKQSGQSVVESPLCGSETAHRAAKRFKRVDRAIAVIRCWDLSIRRLKAVELMRDTARIFVVDD